MSARGIQKQINEDLRKRININHFKQKIIEDKTKNTFNVKCINKQCNSDNVYVESKQTRSADEATTKIYECLTCGQKWTVY